MQRAADRPRRTKFGTQHGLDGNGVDFRLKQLAGTEIALQAVAVAGIGHAVDLQRDDITRIAISQSLI
jgi:hypothetical protein